MPCQGAGKRAASTSPGRLMSGPGLSSILGPGWNCAAATIRHGDRDRCAAEGLLPTGVNEAAFPAMRVDAADMGESGPSVESVGF